MCLMLLHDGIKPKSVQDKKFGQKQGFIHLLCHAILGLHKFYIEQYQTSCKSGEEDE